MDIFDFKPKMPDVKAEFGHEPSLRSIINVYYGRAFDRDAAANYTELYIEALKKENERTK